MLYRDLGALVARHGLHPGFGALHAPRDGTPALVSDLVEAFRAPVAEALTVYLFNNRVLAREHFAEREGDGGIRIAWGGGDRVIRAYETLLERPIRIPGTRTDVLWRGMMEEQVAAWRRMLLGGEAFRPYRMDH